MTDDYQIEPQNRFRIRRVFSIGIIVVNTIEWTGKWFKFIEIEEEECLERYSYFDEWTYTFFWDEWKTLKSKWLLE